MDIGFSCTILRSNVIIFFLDPQGYREKNLLKATILDSLHNYPIRFEANADSSIIGYIRKADLSVFDLPMYKANLKFLRTIYPFDRNGEYFAFIAVKNKPAVVNSDIKNTRSKGKSLEILFNMDGAKKWAAMTKDNTSRKVAFVINNYIYSMSAIAGEIRSGTARIDGLPDEALAEEIAGALRIG